MGDVQDGWRSAPRASAFELVGSGPLLVCVPHPDDETIGAGALIIQARRHGIEVYVDVLTDGSASHPGSVTHSPELVAQLRRREMLRACRRLGVSRAHVVLGESPDGLLALEAPAVDRLRGRIAQVRPSTVITTWVDDPHPDHQAAFWLTAHAVRASSPQPRMLAFPIWSWRAELTPNPLQASVFRLQAASEMPKKLAALAEHRSQWGFEIYDSEVGANLTPREIRIISRMDETFILVNAGTLAGPPLSVRG